MDGITPSDLVVAVRLRVWLRVAVISCDQDEAVSCHGKYMRMVLVTRPLGFHRESNVGGPRLCRTDGVFPSSAHLFVHAPSGCDGLELGLMRALEETVWERVKGRRVRVTRCYFCVDEWMPYVGDEQNARDGGLIMSPIYRASNGEYTKGSERGGRVAGDWDRIRADGDPSAIAVIGRQETAEDGNKQQGAQCGRRRGKTWRCNHLVVNNLPV